MYRKHTRDELNKCGREELVTMVLVMQNQKETLNVNIERLIIEQVRIANRIMRMPSRQRKKDPAVVKRSVAYQALSRIGLIYKLEEALKDISPQEWLRERKTSIKPLVE